MLDRLKTELLLHILSFLSSPSPIRFHPQRFRDLKNLCLVSQGLRQCEQPLLWRTIQVRSRTQVEAVMREAPAFVEAVQTLSAQRTKQLGCSDLPMLFRSLPCLRDVRVTVWGSVLGLSEDRSEDFLPSLAALPGPVSLLFILSHLFR